MKTARLIKRDRLPKQFDKEEVRQTGSQTAISDVRNSVTKWVRERQELQQVSPRTQFAALFRNAF